MSIIELCRTGHIAARALRMEQRSRGWDGEPESVAIEWDVPLWFWRNFTGPESSAQQWDIGTFSGKGRCDECSGYVKLTGVYFLKDSLNALTGGASDDVQGDETVRDNRPQLSLAELERWWASKAVIRAKLSQEELLTLIRAAFPANQVSRERIRELSGGRKRGPKTFGG